jgi:hypothetical protein
MQVSLQTMDLEKTLQNVVNYSMGFLEGAQRGKKKFLENLGEGVIQALGRYVDVSARMNREALHHVYEWYQEGSPSARLFDLKYTVSNLGLSVNSTFRQSSTASKNSSKPFYDKARIMEYGIPVRIAPKPGGVLAFDANGKTVFTKKPVTVFNPGGDDVQGAFEKVFDEFMNNYFRQSFLNASGIYNYIRNPIIYKKEFAKGAKFGNPVGKNAGYKWITNATIGVENG